MTSVERLVTLQFLEQYKKDLIKQVLQNIAKGNRDNNDKARIIKDINKQMFIEKVKTR